MQNKIGNILIVGRNLELLDELYSIFRNKCEIITSATNTQRAIIRAKLLDFSLFIIDATQADNKSLEFMKEIQEVKKPALVKFIILYDGSEVVNNELLKSEFDFDIQKLPVDGNEISWRIDKLVYSAF